MELRFYAHLFYSIADNSNTLSKSKIYWNNICEYRLRGRLKHIQKHTIEKYEKSRE